MTIIWSPHWHKDDNSPYNGRKQRHHQAVQIEILYFPLRVDEDMGPTAIIPYSHYWTINHEENPDNFVTDQFNFNNYERSGMSDLDVASGTVRLADSLTCATRMTRSWLSLSAALIPNTIETILSIAAPPTTYGCAGRSRIRGGHWCGRSPRLSGPSIDRHRGRGLPGSRMSGGARAQFIS